MGNSIEHYRAGAVTLCEINEPHGRWFAVMDPDHYHVRFWPDLETKSFAVGIDAEWSDDKPGALAEYTPSYERGDDFCQPGDASIADDGLLSVSVRQPAASHVEIRMGWTAQLPVEAVEPIRRAIVLTEAVLQDTNAQDRRGQHA